MKGERVAGLLVTIGYTLAAFAAINPLSSGAMQDAVVWFAWLLLLLAGSSYVLSDQAVLAVAGGGRELAVRSVALAIQLVIFGYAGWWWTFGVRIYTEVFSGYRVLMAKRNTHQGYRVDKNERGETYIHCYDCGFDSYHPMDIKNHYCANCSKIHRVINGNDRQPV